MAFWNRQQSDTLTDLSSLMQTHDIVDVKDSHLVVSPKQFSSIQIEAGGLDSIELGRTGSTSYSTMATGEYNASLRGSQGYRKYDQMRRSDGQVKAVLRLVKTPVLAARWYMEPASDSVQDKMIADFVWSNLTKWMSVSWPQLLTEILLMLDFGYYTFEKVWTKKDNNIVWKKFGPRHPMDVDRWEFDANGGPLGLWFINNEYSQNKVFIPIDKLLVFTNDKEAGNIEGISILRAAYKHWYYKDNLYKIDAIQKERHGIGIPCIKLPANFTDSDKALADAMGQNLRTNEKAHVVLPPNWEITMLAMGPPTDSMGSIQHHDEMIAKTVLGQFINHGGAGVEEQQQMFLKATRFIADAIRDVFNKYAIPQLVAFNWPTADIPELRVRRIGETIDWRTTSFAIRNLIGAGIITPDETLEKWMREEMDLPRMDPNSARITETPQLPTPGPPRQSQAKNQQIGTGKTNTGQDSSGG